MKIGLISSSVPLVNGGYRLVVDWLENELRERGHLVETLYVPSTDNPESILQQMAMFRSINLSDGYERVISFRPPAHCVRHPNKVVWFIHHIRIFYDLWDTPYRPFPDTARWRALREQLTSADTNSLNEARHVFANSRTVADRLSKYNGISASVLYPPVFKPERFYAGDYGDEIVCICRFEHHKRQHLLIEALAHTSTQVRLRLCGVALNPDYIGQLQEAAKRHGVVDRLVLDDRWIAETEKVEHLAEALACAYVPFDEDSYGYPTIEAAHARRCTVTVSDSGGVPEFVMDGVNGFVVPPEPAALANIFDQLYEDRARARRLGEAAYERVTSLKIDWDSVVSRLLA